MYEVTIGTPLYNAEKYIRETIECALNQTFPNIEFLIVDDKGTDNSVNIIQDLQINHPRGKDIHIIVHEKNRGVAAARNTILKEAKGKYLFFLDSDDLIAPNCISLLYQAIENEKAEVAYASYQEKWENKNKSENFILPRLVFNGKDQLASFANQNLHQTLRSFVWNVLYDVSFLRNSNVEFQQVRVLEDALFSFDLIPLVEKAVLLPDITYTYIKREGSLSQYHSRTTIPLTEVTGHILIQEYYKSKCQNFIGKPYFDTLVTKTMKNCIDTAAIIIDKRKLLVPRLPSAKIKILLKHPLTFSQILKLKKYKKTNAILFGIGKLPGALITAILIMYINALRAYRRKKH